MPIFKVQVNYRVGDSGMEYAMPNCVDYHEIDAPDIETARHRAIDRVYVEATAQGLRPSHATVARIELKE